MTEFSHRKRAMEEHVRPIDTESASKKDKEVNKREAKRAKRREAKYVAMLLKVSSSTNWNAHDRTAYVLPTKWFSRWKKYVEYEEFVNKHKAAYFGAAGAPAIEHPGRITSEELLADTKEFFHNYSSPEAICNLVLRDFIEESKDYMILSKEIWNYLQKKYEGKSLVRYYINVGLNGNHKLDLKLSRVSLLILLLLL